VHLSSPQYCSDEQRTAFDCVPALEKMRLPLEPNRRPPVIPLNRKEKTMFGMFVASIVSAAMSFAVLAGWLWPALGAGGEGAATWLALGGAMALLSGSALDA
jgi:hypothetical protein